MCRKASLRSLLTNLASWSRCSSAFTASPYVTYSKAPQSRGMPSLTDSPYGNERSWIRRHPPSCFGTRPRGEQTYCGTSWKSTLIRRLYWSCLWRSAVKVSGAARADWWFWLRWCNIGSRYPILAPFRRIAERILANVRSRFNHPLAVSLDRPDLDLMDHIVRTGTPPSRITAKRTPVWALGVIAAWKFDYPSGTWLAFEIWAFWHAFAGWFCWQLRQIWLYL